ncbi:MAG: radical SAM protein [Streptosporangiaceae bacterium]
MHLAEIMRVRLSPFGGLFLALTRRCPLSCAHCTTESSLASEQYPDEPFRQIVASFKPDDRPELIYMSGGEALLRADLVQHLAERAREAGTRSVVLSGMYFARHHEGLTPALRRAIGSVDHFAASLDVFHEREVSRRAVFDHLHKIRDVVADVSMQLTGLGDNDPYILGLVADIRAEFNDEVPILVGRVGRSGRAKEWLDAAPSGGVHDGLEPCFLAAWPLVHYDGTVFACCNQEMAARTRAPHLVLGHARAHTWTQIRLRSRERAALRAIRLFGPHETRRRFGMEAGDEGVCANCCALPNGTASNEAMSEFFDRPGTFALEEAIDTVARAGSPEEFGRRQGIGMFSHLVTLGSRDQT